jgi:hypothetical protein
MQQLTNNCKKYDLSYLAHAKEVKQLGKISNKII